MANPWDGDEEVEVGSNPWDADEVVSPKTAKRSAPGILGSAWRGIRQGATLGFGDEFGGAVQRTGLLGARLYKALGLEAVPEALGIDTRHLDELSSGDVYRQARNAERGEDSEAREANPRAYLAGNIGGSLLMPVPGGTAAKGLSYGQKLLRSAAQGAGMGTAYGLGAGESETVGGMTGDALFGGLAGGAGGVLAEGVVSPVAGYLSSKLGKAMSALKTRATEGVEAAQSRANAMAHTEKATELRQLSGSLGQETQKGSRLTENIRRIPGDAATASPDSQAALMREAARISRERAGDLLEQAKAAGVEDAPATIGEFLSKGSKTDKGQQARTRAAQMIRGAEELEKGAKAVLSGKIAPEALDAGLKQARDIAVESPAFKMLEGGVLSENIRNLPGQAAEIRAARSAFETAERELPEAAAKRASELLSGKAAMQRGKELMLRYGLPALGGYLGSEYGPIGTGAGILLGHKLGGASSAMGALSGAGLRPMAQALYRSATQYPAVQNAMWRGVGGVARAGPERMLDAAPGLALTVGRSDEALALTRAIAEALRRRAFRADASSESDQPLAAAP